MPCRIYKLDFQEKNSDSNYSLENRIDFYPCLLLLVGVFEILCNLDTLADLLKQCISTHSLDLSINQPTNQSSGYLWSARQVG